MTGIDAITEESINIDDYGDDVQMESNNPPWRYNIDSYTNAYPVERLVDDFLNNRIRLPYFQRPYVWNKNDANSARHKPSLFVDSILQGLPIPSISIYRNARDMDTGLLIDGQQRIKTLAWFIRGILEGKSIPFKLKGEGVNESWLGKNFDGLKTEYQDALLRSFIPVTFIRQLNEERPPLPEGSSLFILFDRFNSGGEQLKPHEKRSVLAIYNPTRNVLDSFFADIYAMPGWRDILPTSNIEYQGWRRTTMRELIFRVYAFTLDKNSYGGNLARFLDTFMLKYAMDKETAQRLKEATIRMLDSLGALASSRGKLFTPNDVFNTGFYEAFCVSLLNLLQDDREISSRDLAEAYQEIVDAKLYTGREEGSRISSAAKKVVEKRLGDIDACLRRHVQ